MNRKYSFEKAEVPQESEYLQVRYSMEYPAPQMTDSGLTFSHVFGTNTSSYVSVVGWGRGSGMEVYGSAGKRSGRKKIPGEKGGGGGGLR